MSLSDIGEIANKYWQEIPKHFPFIRLDEFIVMPNHVHGIIAINKSNKPRGNTHVYGGRDARSCVSTIKTNVNT